MYHQQNLTGETISIQSGPPAVEVYRECCQISSLGGQTVQTLGPGRVRAFPYFQKRVDQDVCIISMFSYGAGVGRVGVGSSFLVLIFSEIKMKTQCTEVIGKPSEELHSLLISIKSPQHFCHLSFSTGNFNPARDLDPNTDISFLV